MAFIIGTLFGAVAMYFGRDKVAALIAKWRD